MDEKTYNVSVNMQLDYDTNSLICDGMTHHILSCFKNQTVEMRKNFKRWLIEFDDAKKQGLENLNFALNMTMLY